MCYLSFTCWSMSTCLKVCFVIEFTYLEAILHMWQLFTIWDTYLHILMHVSPLEDAFGGVFIVLKHELHICRHSSPPKCHLNV
jgi:hypothetical protein